MRAFLVAIILLLGTARAQDPNAAHERSRRNAPVKEGAAQSNSLSAPQNPVTKNSPAAVPQADGKAGDSSQEDVKTKKFRNWLHERKEWFWPPDWSNWALAIVAIIGICVTVKTLKAIQRQALIMIRQSRIMQRQARTMERQTDATIVAAKAARDNAQAVLDSERPWLFIPTKDEFSEIESPLLVPRRPGEIRISFCQFWIKNFGRTPARVIEQKIRLVLGRETETIPDAAIYKSQDATAENYSFPPGERIAVQAAFSPGSGITPQELDEITNKRRFVWLCGYFKYTDTFARENSPVYESRVCYRWVYDSISVLDSDIRKSFWVAAGPREYNRAT